VYKNQFEMFFWDYVYQILIKSVHLDWVIQKWWEGGVFYETQCRLCWSHVQLKTMQPVASFVRMRHYWKSHTHVLPMCHASGDALITQYQYSLSNKRAQTDVSQYWVSAYYLVCVQISVVSAASSMHLIHLTKGALWVFYLLTLLA